jgi:hypothetical protein
MALICGRLRVRAHAAKEPVEMRLIFTPQRAAKCCPALLGCLDELAKCGNGPAHRNSACPSSGRKPRSLLHALEGQPVLWKRFDLQGIVSLGDQLPKKCAARRVEGKCVRKDPDRKLRWHKSSLNQDRRHKDSEQDGWKKTVCLVGMRSGRACRPPPTIALTAT